MSELKRIQLKLDDLNPKEWCGKYAEESHAAQLVDYDFTGWVDGEREILVKQLDIDNDAVWNALNEMKYAKDSRSSGMITNSCIIGYRPRIAFRNDFCGPTVPMMEKPKQVEEIIKILPQVEHYFEEYFPEVYQHQKTWVEQNVLPEYRIGDSVFTQGIINQTNRLAYHQDKGNLKGSRAIMLTFNRGTDGGNLVLPEFNVKLKPRNACMFVFDNLKRIHGVSPIRKLAENGNRFSIVFYTLKAMANCLPRKEEIKRFQQVKMEQARKRVYGKD